MAQASGTKRTEAFPGWGITRCSYKVDFWTACLLQLGSCGAVFIMPQLVHALVAYADTSGDGQSTATGFGIVLLFFIATFLKTICDKQFEIRMQKIGVHWRDSVSAMVFQKAPRLSRCLVSQLTVPRPTAKIRCFINTTTFLRENI